MNKPEQERLITPHKQCEIDDVGEEDNDDDDQNDADDDDDNYVE